MSKKTHPIRWSPTSGNLTLGNGDLYRIEKTDRTTYVVETSGIRLGTSFKTLKEAKARAQQCEDHWQNTVFPEIEQIEQQQQENHP